MEDADTDTELLEVETSRGLGLQARLRERRRRQHRFRIAAGLLGLVLVISTSILGWRTYSLTQDRTTSLAQARGLRQQIHDGLLREDDLNKKLATAQTQLSQLSTDATGKDAVIKGLQDDAAAKQGQIDSLTTEVSSLKGCLNGVTLALVQLTNDGSAAAKATIDGVRDVCKQVEVLL